MYFDMTTRYGRDLWFAETFPQWAFLVNPLNRYTDYDDSCCGWEYVGPNTPEVFGEALRNWPLDPQDRSDPPLGYEHAVFDGHKGHGIYVRARTSRMRGAR